MFALFVITLPNKFKQKNKTFKALKPLKEKRYEYFLKYYNFIHFNYNKKNDFLKLYPLLTI